MPLSDNGSVDPNDQPQASGASTGDVFEEAQSGPATPTSDDPQAAGEPVKEGEGSAEVEKDGQDSPQQHQQTLPASIPAPTASTSSLNLPPNDPPPSLVPSSASTDELIASLRTEVTDLTSQVTSLNTKLVKSYTTRGELEDDLHESTELQQRLQKRVAELEVDKKRWEKEIEQGGWVEKNHVQGEMQRLMTKVVEETKSRETAVQAHSALETEIENLTSNLFTEANKMVAFERLSRARAEEKTRSVEEAGVAMQSLLEEVQVGLKDTIVKLEKRDAEVAELKKRLAAHGEHVEEDMADALETADGDVGGIMFSDGEHLTPLDTRALSRSSLGASASPSHLAAPRLLTSVLPYHEFLNFITYLRQLRITALSRPPEGPGYPHPMLAARSLNSDPHPSVQTLSPAQLLAPHLLLSTHLSQPFLKRCVEEDSDPALRLDIAPGLGFLSRRTVGTAIVDGSLLVEPLHAGIELPSDKCALCGCGLEMWLPNSGHLARGKSSTGVNQTMRKMLGGSIFSRSTSSFTPSSASATPSQSAYNSAASSTDSFTLPQPHEKASHHPHDNALQVHLFRASDTASQRYPVCPSYCLARLRAVCEFWTYVRVIERGLLLEEGFKFVQGRSGTTDAPVLSRQASFVRGGSAGPSGATTPTAEKAQQGLGIGPVGAGEHDDVEARDFEAEDTEDSVPHSTKKAEDAPTTPKIVEPAATAEEGDITDAKAGGDVPEGEKKSTTSSTPDLPSTSSPVALSAPPKPARPARSSARNSPAIGSHPSPPPSPATASAPSLPPRRATPAPPPRHPTSAAAVPSSAALDVTPSSGAGDILSSAIGWEDRCWSEVVRLKESVFWARVAAVAPDGGAVSSAGARVWVQ
ncbi:hypothetical protein JCM10213_000546 [Rhodosporidiobolus nylandii]